MTLLEQAKEYQNKYGFSIIPCGKDKKPYIKWETYSKRKPTNKELEMWFSRLFPSANIAIITGKVSNLVVIDIDTDEGRKAIKKYIPKDIETPIVLTPNGGRHLYFQCPDPPLPNNARRISGCDFRGEGGYVLAPPSIISDKKSYKWIKALEKTAIQPLPASYINYITGNSGGGQTHIPSSDSPPAERKKETAKIEHGTRDETLFHLANALVKSGMPINEINFYLEKFASLACNPPYSANEATIKIESALKRAYNREKNITEEIKNWIATQDGEFTTKDCYSELQAQNTKEKAAARKALQRLCEESIIKHVSRNSGRYRIVNVDIDEINYEHANEKSVDIKLPLGVERLVRIFPKNISIISGTPDSGKTTFLLNIPFLNQNREDIYYFSSEMGEVELKERLMQFDMPLPKWKRIVKFYERSGDFADVIRPDAINIIDFLEMHEDFWRVSGLIRAIWEKLHKGIAFIALQKNPGAHVALGGWRAMEKARLGIAMEWGRAEIVKAKNPISKELNPRGMKLEFQIIQGCRYIVTKNWTK